MGSQPPEQPNAGSGERMRVIVVETDSSLRENLSTAFSRRGHTATPVDSTDEAVRWIKSGVVDLVVADLPNASFGDRAILKSIHAQRRPIPLVITTNGKPVDLRELLGPIRADTLACPFSDESIDDAIERVQAQQQLHGDTLKILPYLTEIVRFVIPSRVEFLDGVLNHLTNRLVQLGFLRPESIDVVVALDEAIVNAIKHGNGYDAAKLVTIEAEFSAARALFTISDEGPGFREQDVPDPCAPENLLRPSGRGLLLIRSIMDEVSYNSTGNVLTMVKYSETRRDQGSSSIQ
ncbi:MAG: ATP-binding protein [Blastocatellia bacterium]|nr:ATP-binding protein [Blastocatellia bacterium]